MFKQWEEFHASYWISKALKSPVSFIFSSLWLGLSPFQHLTLGSCKSSWESHKTKEVLMIWMTKAPELLVLDSITSLPFHLASVASVLLSLTWPKMFPFPLFWKPPNSRYAPAYQPCSEMLQLMTTLPVILLTVSNKKPQLLWPCWLLYRVAAALEGRWVHLAGSASTFIPIPGSRIRRPSLRLSFRLSIPLPISWWDQNHSSAFEDQNPSQLFS